MFVAAFAPYITYKFLNFVGVDVYHAMSSEQEAKAALNRPVPVPSAPMNENAKKVLGDAPDGGNGPAPQGGPIPPARTRGSDPSPVAPL